MTLPPATPPPGPLDGIRVLDASTGIAGPMAAMYLADFGADVIKLEPPGGDPGRARPGFAMWNRNKRGIVIDPADAVARARRDAFLRGADVCLFSETRDVLATHGLDPETVRAGNGRLIYLHMPPFLPDATPWAGGAESAAMIEAGTGIAMAQFSFEPAPVDSVAPHVLYTQAMWGATAAVAALAEREASGAGQTVDVGGLHGMLQAMTGGLTQIPGAQFEMRPGGPGGSMPQYRTYECRDGQWLFLASLTPAFFVPVLDMLGLMPLLTDERLAGDPLAVALPENIAWAIDLLRAAFLQRPRDEWLRLLAEIPCPAAPVADRADWLDHPQVRAIGMRTELDDPERGRVVMPGLPLQLTRSPAAVRSPAPTLGQHDAVVAPWPPPPPASADAPARDGPLAGVRVLDLGTIIAGPHAGALLAELGADVVKVETIDGDFSRQFGIGFVGFNKGKRGLAVDLRSEAGHAVFLDLARDADIVIDNFRQGVMERLRIDYACLRAVNPEISAISVTGYGVGGDLDGAPGFDPVLQAYAGMMHAQGGDSDPVFATLPVNDVSTAATLALGAVLALLHQRRGGGGQRGWTSLAGQACMMQSGEIVRYAGRRPAHRGGADFAGPDPLDRYYRTRDGWLRLQAIDVGAGRDGPAERAAAIAALHGAGLLPPALTDDDALSAALFRAIEGLDTADAERRCRDAGIPAMRVRSLQQLPSDPFLDDTEALHRWVPHVQAPGGPESLSTVGRLARFSRTEKSGVLAAPGLGEHTLEILAGTGRDAAAAADLLAAGAVALGEPFVAPPPP
jgi:crotonobetainyl-CoA:carnitine CoA-transferase CaiB-like acyl-CoA transferase